MVSPSLFVAGTIRKVPDRVLEKYLHAKEQV